MTLTVTVTVKIKDAARVYLVLVIISSVCIICRFVCDLNTKNDTILSHKPVQLQITEGPTLLLLVVAVVASPATVEVLVVLEGISKEAAPEFHQVRKVAAL